MFKGVIDFVCFERRLAADRPTSRCISYNAEICQLISEMNISTYAKHLIIMHSFFKLNDCRGQLLVCNERLIASSGPTG